MSEDREDRGEGIRKSITSVDDLDVFRKSYRLSLEVHRATLTFPDIEQRALADQIRRASKSIPANLAEGFAKHFVSTAEFKRYVMIALGSTEEMRVWVRYCLDLGYVNDAVARRWLDGYQEIARMLVGLYRSWR